MLSVKSSTYYFHVKANILADFQICLVYLKVHTVFPLIRAALWKTTPLDLLILSVFWKFCFPTTDGEPLWNVIFLKSCLLFQHTLLSFLSINTNHLRPNILTLCKLRIRIFLGLTMRNEDEAIIHLMLNNLHYCTFKCFFSSNWRTSKLKIRNDNIF